MSPNSDDCNDTGNDSIQDNVEVCKSTLPDTVARPNPIPNIPPNMMEYDVCLQKQIYGLGIYFVELGKNEAFVDSKFPFYRLPNDQKGPGEASNVIKPGDQLIGINGINFAAENYSFKTIVQKLRSLQDGQNVLRFRTKLPTVANRAVSIEFLEERRAMEERLQCTIADLQRQIEKLEINYDREKKCCTLATQKLNLYRGEIMKLNGENSNLRAEIRAKDKELKLADEFIEFHSLLPI